MKRLYLVRHGIAVPHGTPEIPDDERPLTPEGERRVRQVAQGLRQLGVKLDRIVTSPLPRAATTARIIAETFKATDRLDTDDALRAGESAASIASWLEGREEEQLMIVGHNPTFSDLATTLPGTPGAPARLEMKKAAVVALKNMDGHWTLEWFAPPALLRRIRG